MNPTTLYVFRGEPQLPTRVNRDGIEKLPNLIETRTYRTTREWTRVIQELSLKYPNDPSIHVINMQSDQAGTMTTGPLSGEVWAMEEAER